MPVIYKMKIFSSLHVVFPVALCLTRITCYTLLPSINTVASGSLRLLHMVKMVEILNRAAGQVGLFVLTGFLFELKDTALP